MLEEIYNFIEEEISCLTKSFNETNSPSFYGALEEACYIRDKIIEIERVFLNGNKEMK